MKKALPLTFIHSILLFALGGRATLLCLLTAQHGLLASLQFAIDSLVGGAGVRQKLKNIKMKLLKFRPFIPFVIIPFSAIRKTGFAQADCTVVLRNVLLWNLLGLVMSLSATLCFL